MRRSNPKLFGAVFAALLNARSFSRLAASAPSRRGSREVEAKG